MLDLFLSESSFLWRCIWQTTACLVLGGVFSFLWIRRPARAHRVLLLAMVAALATPFLSQLVHEFGWGILRVPSPTVRYSSAAPSPAVSATQAGVRSNSTSSVSPSVNEEETPSVVRENPSTGAGVRQAKPSIHISTLFLWMWVGLSGVCFLRLLMSLAEGYRMVSRARPVADEVLERQVREVASELGLGRPPQIFFSEEARCPQIWSWRKHPALLLPQLRELNNQPNEWQSILCHELAHLKRRDHLAVLFAEVLICLIPWQVLAWWAKRRLVRLSEQSCDDWVLARGNSPATYAELVLSLRPQRRPALALSAISGGNGLQRRIHHILRGRQRDPRPGRRWAWAATAAAACVATTIAIGQTQATTKGYSGNSLPGSPSPGHWEQTAHPTFRLIKAGRGSDFSSPPSVDTQFVVDEDIETGGLLLRNLATGEIRRLGDKTSWQDTGGYAEHSLISPDFTKVIYSWCKDENDLYELHILGIDGSPKRVLYSPENLSYLYPADWSLDSKRILVIQTVNEECQIVLISAADGSSRVVKSFGKRQPGTACFSADGKYVAYDLPKQDNLRDYDIFSITTDGSEETPLRRSETKEKLLGWSVDGKWILYASDHLGNMDAYIIPMANGKPDGHSRLIKKAIGDIDRPKGFTRDGSYYYAVEYDEAVIYTAEIDTRMGKLLSPPTRTGRGAARSCAWAPDGKHLAYVDVSEDIQTLCIQSLDKRELRQISLPLGHFQNISWSPDGSSVLCYKAGEGLCTIALETGAVDMVVKDPPSGYQVTRGQWLPDGKSIIYQCLSPEKVRFMIRDMQTGAEKEIYSNPNPIWYWAVSPDGKRLAFVSYDLRSRSSALNVVSTAPRAEPREILSSDRGIHFAGWTPDSKALLYQPSLKSLWRVSAEGGERRELCVFDRALSAVSIHPDGKHVAFNSGSYKHEVWVMEDFLPMASSPRDKILPDFEEAIAAAESPTESLKITDTLVTDDFDDGDVEGWYMSENRRVSPVHGYTVENGELILENAEARIGRPDWKDYVVRVRFCIERVSNRYCSGSIRFRDTLTPELTGSYRLALNPWQGILHFDFGYFDESATYQHNSIARSSYNCPFDEWHTLRLEVEGSDMKGYVDDELVVDGSDKYLTRGSVGLAAWNARARFDDFSLRLLP